jgi:hypothetical protein
VERQTSRRQPRGKPGFDLDRLLPGVAVHHEVVRVSDQDWGAVPGGVISAVSGSRSRLHPVQGDVEQRGLTIPPWGGRCSVRDSRRFSITPALNYARIIPLAGNEPIIARMWS